MRRIRSLNILLPHCARAAGTLALAASLVLLAACTANPAVRDARDLTSAGRNAEALELIDKASREHPDNLAYRSELFRQRELAVTRWMSQAEVLRFNNRTDLARDLYKQVLKYDKNNTRAELGLRQLDKAETNARIIETAERLVRENKLAEAQDLLRPVLTENPEQREARRLQRVIEGRTVKPAIVTQKLKTASTKPLSIEMRDVTLASLFDVVGRSTGLSFVFDKDVRTDTRTSLAVHDASPEELLNLVLSTNQLDRKQINDTTLILYPNTAAKQREYQELVIRSFYLANADVKNTANMVRTMLKTRDIFIDEKLNLLVIKDTPNNIRMAEKLIQTQDLAEPEVMLEVEVLEIASTRLLNLGIQYPGSVAVSLVGGGSATTTGTGGTTTTSGGTPGVLSLPEWLNRNAGLVRLAVSDPAFAVSLTQQDGTTNVLANPRIRVRNKEKARVHIGNRVPVITTTAAAAGGFVSESVSYLDVGLKLEVEPQIFLDDEVGIRVGLEVSSILGEVHGSSSTDTLAYQVGTRNANTVLRLRDGETQILAGLIDNEDRRTANRVPGLGDLPILGRLFSATSDNGSKTEIVLLITPHLMRTLRTPDSQVMEFSAGTEASAGGGGSAGGGTGFTAPPPISGASPTPTAPRPASQPSSSYNPSTFPSSPTAPLSPTVPSQPTLVPFGGLQTTP